MAAHHYMVDYNDADGRVRFANDQHIADLATAKALARKISKKYDNAAVVAYVAADDLVLGGPTYSSVGAIMYFQGRVSSTDGMVA